MRRTVLVALLLATACNGGGDRAPSAGPTSTGTDPATATAAPTTAPAATPPPDRPKSMAALGDSITRAFLDCPELGDCPAASWSTGTDADITSHATRLGAGVQAHNLAVSGAQVSGLPGQAQRAVDAEVGYVTILIGANDACRGSESAMTPVTDFAKDFERAMTTLTRGLPEAKILVASIPDLQRLWEVGKDDEQVRGTWERFGICRSVLAPDAPRARVRQRVQAYNAAMAAACAKHPNCRYDGNAVFDYEFTLDDVSPRDYWHPSRAGQRTLAEVTWKAGWWG